MSKYFNLQRDRLISTYIQEDIIHLLSDFSDNNIHFIYKDIEVTSEHNIPYPYYNIDNPKGLLKQIIGEYNQIELCQEDYFRKLIIHMDIKTLSMDEDEEDDDEEYENDDEDEDDESYETSYNDQLKNHYPGLYLSDNQIKGYDSAESKRDLLKTLLDDEEVSDTLFGFAYIKGLKIYDDRVEFMAPKLSMSTNEWIFWAVNVIDKILDYYKDDDEDELDEDGDEDE